MQILFLRLARLFWYLAYPDPKERALFHLAEGSELESINMFYDTGILGDIYIIPDEDGEGYHVSTRTMEEVANDI